MTEFKKGQRVTASNPDREGTVVVVDTGCREVDVLWDGESHVTTEYQHLITKIMPRFEDVHTGDQITVEFSTGFSLTGPATAKNGRVGIVEACWHFRPDGDGNWKTTRGDAVTLTAHTPAEPEWHRAQVIKAGAPFITDTYLLRGLPGEFYDQGGNKFLPVDLTDVKIIIDEHGQVQS